jgi:hypothetical protein
MYETRLSWITYLPCYSGLGRFAVIVRAPENKPTNKQQSEKSFQLNALQFMPANSDAGLNEIERRGWSATSLALVLRRTD